MASPATPGQGTLTDGGLPAAEARRLLAIEGPNELPSPGRRSFLRIVREVLSEPMFLLLIAAGTLYLVLGDVGEAATLLLFANLSMSIAVVQELRSERVLEALRGLAAPSAHVIRDGRRERIPGRELVRGDLVLVGEGDRVPADARMVEGSGVEADESLLTGESVPVTKRVATAADDGPRPSPGGDSSPWLYSGSLVVRGQARAVVVATGERSEIGRIGRSLGSIEPEPARLQAHTRRLVRLFGAGAIVLSSLVVALYAAFRGGMVDALLAGIAVGMSLLPEEFPLVLAVFLVMGARRISRAGVLTRRAAAIESLGAATVLCTDKTGTLTENRMKVVALVPWRGEDGAAGEWRLAAGGQPPVGQGLGLLATALLATAHDALDPMDRAVHERAAEAGLDVAPALDRAGLVREFGLSAERPVMTMLRRDPAGRILASAKGAPESVASLCGLEEAARRDLAVLVDDLADEGIRVLAVAASRGPVDPVTTAPEDIDFALAGLVGFADPLREGVPAAVAECLAAGVRVVMVTGDYPLTARAIARQAGLDSARVLGGTEVAAMDDPALAAALEDCSVFARILPEQKLRIVEALKARGHVVAMTGDGVNDAPSLRAAHIGVAMGRRGTDVAREAASIVLLEDDFRSLVTTLRLGRRVHDNLRKAMGYVVALHVPIAGLAVLPLVLGLPLVLTPTVIAFLEMIIDPVCSLVFEAEPEERGIMQRPPREPDAPILPAGLLAWCLLQGVVALAAVAGVLVVAVARGVAVEDVRAMVFACLVSSTLALMFANRSFATSSREAIGRPNALAWVAVAASAAMLVASLGWEPGRELLKMGALHAHDAAVAAGLGVALFVVLQGIKAAWKPPLAT